jgi:hypothetical protein
MLTNGHSWTCLYLSYAQEEEYLSRNGVYCGYSGVSLPTGHHSKGVYLSLHPDACVPSPIMDGMAMRFLVFKVLFAGNIFILWKNTKIIDIKI